MRKNEEILEQEKGRMFTGIGYFYPEEVLKLMHEAQLEPFRAINPVHPEKVMENLEILVKSIEQFMEYYQLDVLSRADKDAVLQTLSAMKEGVE